MNDWLSANTPSIDNAEGNGWNGVDFVGLADWRKEWDGTTDWITCWWAAIVRVDWGDVDVLNDGWCNGDWVT